MTYDSEPIICGSAFLVIVLALIFGMILWRHFQPREEFSAEESEALRRQGNVLGCGIMSIWLLGGILWGIAQLVPMSTETLQSLAQAGAFTIAIGIGVYLGISTIKDRVSIIRWGRGWHPLPRGEDAVMSGTQLLIVIGAVLLIAWIVSTAR